MYSRSMMPRRLAIGKWHFKTLVFTCGFLVAVIYFCKDRGLGADPRTKRQQLVIRPSKPYKSFTMPRRKADKMMNTTNKNLQFVAANNSAPAQKKRKVAQGSNKPVVSVSIEEPQRSVPKPQKSSQQPHKSEKKIDSSVDRNVSRDTLFDKMSVRNSSQPGSPKKTIVSPQMDIIATKSKVRPSTSDMIGLSNGTGSDVLGTNNQRGVDSMSSSLPAADKISADNNYRKFTVFSDVKNKFAKGDLTSTSSPLSAAKKASSETHVNFKISDDAVNISEGNLDSPADGKIGAENRKKVSRYPNKIDSVLKALTQNTAARSVVDNGVSGLSKGGDEQGLVDITTYRNEHDKPIESATAPTKRNIAHEDIKEFIFYSRGA